MSEPGTIHEGPTPRKMSQATKDVNALIYKMAGTTSPVRLELLNDEIRRLLGEGENRNEIKAA